MTDGTVTAFDLNPSLNYALLPNLTAKASALAQPAAVVFEPGGAFLYVAAFGTDRVARVGSGGQVLSRIEIGPATGSTVAPRTKRGPRGLALNPVTARLYVLNRISNTVSIIDTTTDTVVREINIGSFDPTPVVIRNGRGFLYDAKLSGNGTASCAACHVDADMDFLAWDLGNPGGSLQNVSNSGTTFSMHPMKGPMTTQTFRGLSGTEPLHWRGDRADFTAFNPAFSSLLGGAQLSSADMTAFRDFINTLRFQPNPNQNLDRTLSNSVAGGDANAGRNSFINEDFTTDVSCNDCHTANPGTGTNRSIFSAATLQEPQDLKVPQLRNIYQKQNFNNAPGAQSIDGFGLTHDGQDANLFQFLSRPVFDRFAGDTVRQNNLRAFLLSFDTGTAPAVGYTRTLYAANAGDPSMSNAWTLLENQAAAGNIDLIAKGTIDGQRMGLLYRTATNDYKTDKTGAGPFTRTQLGAKLAAGDTLSLMGVPPGSGTRMGIDRNSDGTLDNDPPPPPPAAPTSLTATASSTRGVIKLAWADNSSNEQGFKLERCSGSSCTNYAQVAQISAGVRTFTNSGLTSNTTYSYRVRAFNIGGNSAYSNRASVRAL